MMTHCTSGRTGSLLPLTVAVVLFISISLPGCSRQNEPLESDSARGEQGITASDTSSATPVAGSRAEQAALVSDAPPPPPDASEGVDYDPWESFNEKTFSFNFNVLDHYALKPAAKVWSEVLPEPARQGLANAFDNLAMPKRFVNKTLQGRLPEAGEELARFLINTTAGVAGFVDVASRVGLQKSNADTGETLAMYGITPGPYLVLPLLPPLTVRDAIGYAGDSFMDPLSYFVTPLGVDVGRSAANQINERSNNMALYQDVEDTSIDLYAAVRNGYLQRRRVTIQDAIRDRHQSWESIADSFEPDAKPIPGKNEQVRIGPPANQSAHGEYQRVELDGR
jgi:phospholipid-binding lipoprotein MlaA